MNLIYIASAGASVPRYSPSRALHALAVLLVFCITTAAHATPITWIGGGGNNLWSNALNWDAGIVPCNTGPLAFDVIIPANAGTINFDLGGCTIDSISLGDNSTLHISPATDLIVLGAADIFGIIDGQGGHLTATGSGAAFPGNRARVFAASGSLITIHAPTYSSAGIHEATIFAADGQDTRINLPMLTSLSTAFNDANGNIRTQTITATNGGTIDLSGVVTLSPPARNEDRIDIVMSDDQSTIDLASLQTINGAGGRTHITLSNSALLSLPSIQTLEDVIFQISGGALCEVTSPSPVAYTTTGINGGTIIIVSDAGSLLDLSPVTGVDTGFNDANGNVRVQTITATAGGTIDLSGVVTLSPPARNEDRIDIVMSGASHIDMSSLQTVGTGGGGKTTFALNDPLTTLDLGGFTNSGSDVPMTISDADARLNMFGTFNLGTNITITAPAGFKFGLDDGFCYAHSIESNVQLARADVSCNGSGTLSDPQFLEVGGLNVGSAIGVLTNDNFALGRLIVGQTGQPTVVQLSNTVNNGNDQFGTEALYLFGQPGAEGLELLNGSTLVLSNLDVYVFENGINNSPNLVVHLNSLFGPGVTEVPYSGGFLHLGVDDCLADVNNDGSVTPADFTAWIAAFNNGDHGCDQNGDCLCTPADFTAWISNFNAGC